ncbi:MAG: PP2C family protein-serine/threonine phosphatase [Termitinemataceae bacterium]
MVYGIIAFIYCIRASLGFLFSYGSQWLTWTAVALAVFQSVIALWNLQNRKKPAHASAYLSTTQRRPFFELFAWAVLSVFFLIDALFASTADTTLSVLSPWALLVLAPVVLQPCEGGSLSLFAAALPAAFGMAEAAGAFTGGSPRLSTLVSLLIAFVLGSVTRMRGLQRRAEMEGLLSLQKDRERHMLKVQDMEAEIAARIQRTLLVDQTPADHTELALDAITVASNAVDGDFYGLIPYSSTKLDLLVGDVMGKGIPAALVGAALKGTFLRQCLRLIVEQEGRLPSPMELVTEVHRSVGNQLMDLDRFATLQYVRFDVQDLLMTFVDCGHTPFIHYDASLHICWTIKGTNLPIGFTEEHIYHSYQIPLSIGDRFLFYSGGISEARNDRQELFGEQRLAEIVQMNATLPPRELLRRILNTAMFFASDNGFKDDVTCVAVSINPEDVFMVQKVRDFSCEPQSLAGVSSFVTQVLAEILEQDRLETIVTAVVEAAEKVIVQVHKKEPEKESSLAQVQAPVQHQLDMAVAPGGENLVEELDEGLEALESGTSGFPPLTAYRIEIRQTDVWCAVRIMYHGEPLPQKRGLPFQVCTKQQPDSVYVAKGQENLALVGLLFLL